MRVAVTGVGVVCSLGRSVAEAWPRVLAGERGIGPITLFEVEGQRATLAAEVKGLEPVRIADVACSRTDTLALLAAKEALAEARIDPKSMRVGLVVGGTTGGMFETERLLGKMHADVSARVPTPEMLAHPLSATVDRLSAALGPFARERSVCSACSSGANAFAIGKAWIELGLVDVALVGGTDGLCRLTLTGFNALNAVDPEPTRPFDARRRGLTLGEGAGFAILEPSERARARGIEPRVELVGVGITSEAHHITNPDESGDFASRAIKAALKSADLEPSLVDYVNAHGTGTQLNDSMEVAALVRAFEKDAPRIHVSSTKAQIGHTLGASGAIEAIFAVLSVRDGKIPPTAGLEEVDPKCVGVRHVPKVGIDFDVRVALSNAFGFGGVDTVLAFARAGLAPEKIEPARDVYITGIGSASRAGALQWEENASLVASPPQPPVEDDPTGFLDVARARRLDRAARLGVTATNLAWVSGHDGVILGSSYGHADGSAAFLARLFEKGARFAPPADFPNLVPSAPTGHASIYLNLHGMALAVADLAASGEAAFATAWELVASGTLDATGCGSVEGPNEIAATSIAPVFRDPRATTPTSDRTEGSAVVRLTREPGPEARIPERIIVRKVVQARELADAIAQVEAPIARAVVVVPEITPALREIVAASGWKKARLLEVAPSVGRHEGLGGFTLAAAAALLAKGDVDETLILGSAQARAYAIVIDRF